MSRFIEGENRQQCTLLPELLDDYIAPNNSVRVIEAFVDDFTSLARTYMDTSIIASQAMTQTR